jgi:hypothetical protein
MITRKLVPYAALTFAAATVGVLAVVVATHKAPASPLKTLAVNDGRAVVDTARERSARLDYVTQRLGVQRAALRRIAGVATPSGGAEIWVGPRTDGTKVCMILERPGAGLSAGCGGRRDPFIPGHHMVWREESQGGPAPERMTLLEIIGLARENVSRIVIIDTSGALTPVSVGTEGEFAFAAPSAMLARGDRPAEIVALSRSGVEVDRMQIVE